MRIRQFSLKHNAEPKKRLPNQKKQAKFKETYFVEFKCFFSLEFSFSCDIFQVYFLFNYCFKKI